MVTTFYAAAGGFKTVVWTDNLQLLVLLAGALAIPVVVELWLGKGPEHWWHTFSQAGRARIKFFTWDPTERITVLGTVMTVLFGHICTHGSDQVMVQRYLSTPSLRAAQRSVWVFVTLYIFIVLALMLSGLALFAFYADRSGMPIQQFQERIAMNADRIMPRFIATELPSGISGLMVAALVAAAMSSLSSGINSIAGVIVSDFLQRFGFFEARRSSLWMDKLVTIAAGLTSVLLALAIAVSVKQTNWNLTELGGRLNQIFVGPLGVLFFSGLLFRRVGKQAVFLAFSLATIMSVVICFGGQWLGFRGRLSFLWIIPIPFLLGLSCAGILGFLFPVLDQS